MLLKPDDLDRGELAILAALQVNARLSTQDLADEVGLSSSATWRRVKALEERGMIQGYVALLDGEKLGFKECVFAQVKLAKHDTKSLEEFERSVLRRPEVLECFAMSGASDYTLRIMVRSNREYERFLKEAIFSCPAVEHIQSNFALRQVKFSVALPVS